MLREFVQFVRAGVQGWVRAPGRLWRARQRRIDREILFPQLSRLTHSTTKVMLALRAHMADDPAWANPDEFSPIDADFRQWVFKNTG